MSVFGLNEDTGKGQGTVTERVMDRIVTMIYVQIMTYRQIYLDTK